MGFYVDLEMPKDCPMCPFANYDIFNTFSGCDITSGKRWAAKNDKDYAESSTRPDWCPLVELPPHGRLIDADAVMLHIQDYIEEYDDDLSDNGYHSEKWCAMKEAEMVINDAPTIIEAEEGE